MLRHPARACCDHGVCARCEHAIRRRLRLLCPPLRLRLCHLRRSARRGRPMHMPAPCICARGARAVHARSGRAHRPARTQHAPSTHPARTRPALPLARPPLAGSRPCHVPLTRRMDPHPSLASLSLQRRRLRCTAHCHGRRRAGGMRGLEWRGWGRVHVCGAEGRVGARRQAVSRWACVKARPLPRDSSPPPTPPLHTQARWPWGGGIPWGGGRRRPARVCGL